MIEFTLDTDERIIQEFEGAIWFSDNHRELEKLILTDQGLYCAYYVKNEWTGNDKGEIYRFNLSDIVIKDGVSMICKAKIRQTSCLQIQFQHGLEYLGFFEGATVKTTQLIKEINQLLGAQTLKTPAEGTFVCYSCGYMLPNGANYCFNCGRKTVKEEKAAETKGKTYYFAINGETKGPFSLEEVRKLVERGMLKRDTLSWTKKMKDWTPMEQIQELKEITDSLPPVI